MYYMFDAADTEEGTQIIAVILFYRLLLRNNLLLASQNPRRGAIALTLETWFPDFDWEVSPIGPGHWLVSLYS